MFLKILNISHTFLHVPTLLYATLAKWHGNLKRIKTPFQKYFTCGLLVAKPSFILSEPIRTARNLKDRYDD